MHEMLTVVTDVHGVCHESLCQITLASCIYFIVLVVKLSIALLQSVLKMTLFLFYFSFCKC